MGVARSAQMRCQLVVLALLSQLAFSLPLSNTTVNGEPPCCQGKCAAAGQEKYWSIASSLGPFGGKKHCGECCIDPKNYNLYHFFEKNLTKSVVDSPCESFGFTKYDSTVTHGAGPIKVTLDLYDVPTNSTPSPSPPGRCEGNEYCCPDAKACLFPTETSCKDDDNACGKGEVCCPLTKICVLPRKPCVSSCKDAGSYCCPITKHCVTATNPGVICHGDKECQPGEACCPTTKVCVKLGATCNPNPPSFSDILLNRWG